MHRTVTGWVIYGGRHCRRAKIFFTCPSGESNLGRWIYRQKLYHVAVKAGFYHKAVEVFHTYHNYLNLILPAPISLSTVPLFQALPVFFKVKDLLCSFDSLTEVYTSEALSFNSFSFFSNSF